MLSLDETQIHLLSTFTTLSPHPANILDFGPKAGRGVVLVVLVKAPVRKQPRAKMSILLLRDLDIRHPNWRRELL
jgi:hypothetical protein